MKNPYKINNYCTNVHIYRGQLIFGDAYKIINELKKSHAPEKSSDPDPFLEWDEIQLDNLDWKKRHSIIASNHHGGCWTPIFDCQKEDKNVDALFIDTAAAHLFPHPFAKSDACGSKEHLKLLNEMIEKTLIKNKDLKVEKKVNLELNFPSGKILFMQSAKEVRFETKDEGFEIDYKTKTEEEIYSELYKLYYKPKIKFINFQIPLEDYTLDFYVDELSYKGPGSHLMYPIKSAVEDLDWFANYYSKYFSDEKDIYKKRKPTKKEVEELKKWSDEQNERIGLKPESFEEHEERMSEPLIKKYKDYVERFGFTHGYYIVPENILDIDDYE